MLAIASQIILCLVLAALLGLIIGYLLGKTNCPKNAYRAETGLDPHTHDDGDCDDQDETDVEKTDADEEIPTSDASPQSLMSLPEETTTEDRTTDTSIEERTTDTSTEASSQKDSESAQNVAPTDASTSASSSAEEKSPSDAAKKPDDTAADTKEKKSPPKAKKEKKSSTKKTPSKTATDASSTTEELPSDEDKPATLLDAPRNGEKDNLTRIKGIGVKIDSLLNETGVYHFDQIAAWSEKEAAWIDHKVSFPGRSLRDDWVGQAKLLAEGKETEFSKRVDKGEVSSSKKA